MFFPRKRSSQEERPWKGTPVPILYEEMLALNLYQQIRVYKGLKFVSGISVISVEIIQSCRSDQFKGEIN